MVVVWDVPGIEQALKRKEDSNDINMKSKKYCFAGFLDERRQRLLLCEGDVINNSLF